MACITEYSLHGILADCNPTLAGITEVWIGYYGDFNVSADTTTYSSAGTCHNVTSIQKTSGGKDMEHYTFAKQTGSLNSTFTKDETNGVRYWTNAITLQFSRLEGRKHLEVEALSVEQLVAIVHDGNGRYWYVGYDGYLSATSSQANTGASYDDFSGYQLEMSAMSAFLPLEMTKAQVDSVTGGN